MPDADKAIKRVGKAVGTVAGGVSDMVGTVAGMAGDAAGTVAGNSRTRPATS